jgi:hypothetical protein
VDLLGRENCILVRTKMGGQCIALNNINSFMREHNLDGKASTRRLAAMEGIFHPVPLDEEERIANARCGSIHVEFIEFDGSPPASTAHILEYSDHAPD